MHKLTKFLIVFNIFWFSLVVFSFSQLDLNLTLYAMPIIVSFQKIMQQLGFYQRFYSSVIYLIIVSGLFWGYLGILLNYKGFTLAWLRNKQFIFMSIFIIYLGVIAYPLFSHDIFNYLFNAKMVLVYHSNPHIHTALEFINDPWVRFMHNVHTSAPYAYGWTGLSLIPVLLTIKKFTLSLWMMKVLVIIFFLVEVWAIYKLAKLKFVNNKFRLLLFAFNPLILMETIIIGHNDSVMMGLMLVSLLFFERIISVKYSYKVKNMILFVLHFLLSVAIKYATIVLLPFIFLYKKIDLYTWGGIALLLVLLTRPGQIHSWYLHWGIALLVLSRYKWGQTLAVLLSVGGMLRYIPYLYTGIWTGDVYLWRIGLLFLPFLVLLIPKFRQNFL